MMYVIRKITAAFATGVLVASTLIAPAFAQTNANISDNGSSSNNSVEVQRNSRTDVDQRNNADITNNVDVRVDTGNNRVSDNRDDAAINTGDVRTSVNIFNLANVNVNRLNINDLIRRRNDRNDDNRFRNDDRFERTLRAFMTGRREVPGPGDPNGFGTAQIRLLPARGEVCATLRVFNIARATEAHIHRGSAGVAGPIVVTLPTPNASGFANRCVRANSNTLREIRDNPSRYYVNVHTNQFPDGAIRGQLMR